MVLADAERLAIRRLLSKSVADQTLSPGPPLPRSHPSPALLAKLQLNVLALYEAAGNDLSAASKDRSGASGKASKTTLDDATAVTGDLRAYVDLGTSVAAALSYKWLGVDLGEGGVNLGRAVGWLQFSERSLRDVMKLPVLSTLGKRKGAKKQTPLSLEAAAISSFLVAYRRVNDKVPLDTDRSKGTLTVWNPQVSFQPVPNAPALMTAIPTGRAALALKPYMAPAPAFVARSDRYEQVGIGTAFLESSIEGLNLATTGENDVSDGGDSSPDDSQPYALSSGYY